MKNPWLKKNPLMSLWAERRLQGRRRRAGQTAAAVKPKANANANASKRR